MASGWDGINETQARLLSASTATGDPSTLTLGLQFRMQKDWKIYWRSPGDAGYPPALDWTGSQNFSEAGISWPAPIRFSVLGFETVGYHDEVVLPITVTLVHPGEPASFRLAVNYLTCSTICVPAMAHLSLDIPAGAASPSEFAALIQSYINRVPGDGAKAGLAIEKVESGGTMKHPALAITARARDALSVPDIFVEGSQTLRFGRPNTDLSDSERLAYISIPVSAVPGAPLILAGSEVTLTLVDGDRSAEYRSKVAQGAILPDAPPESSLAEFLAVLGFGVLGGLVLNLMPCVLPVLSIKLLSVVEAGGRERRTARLGFLASAAGIVASFLVLAGVLTAFKAAGYAIGWGIQF
ncbi:MAG: protein-disulfide reductase DsbD domain-containing protein, partial [Alphaproteobacteria bacterium]